MYMSLSKLWEIVVDREDRHAAVGSQRVGHSLVTEHVCMLSLFSHVGLCATLCTAARQDPLSLGIIQQEYWSGLLCPPPGYLHNTGIIPTQGSNLCLFTSPALADGFFTTSATWEANNR